MNRLILILTGFLLSCVQSNKNVKQASNNSLGEQNNSKMTLIDNVRLAINPKFQDWVLFENGTYIIFDNVDTIADVKAEAMNLMKEFGPVYVGSPAGDFSVTHLNQTEGWVVSGHCYGMYTYVNPTEIEKKNPNDAEIGLLGRSKRERDGGNPVIIYINSKK